MFEKNYYSVSLVRFLFFSVLSFGLYDIYWLFKNWECIEENEEANINPLIRAIFAPIFNYSLFKKINTSLKEIEYRSLISPSILFFLYLLCLIFTIISDKIAPFLPSISFLPLLYVQKQINVFHQKNGIKEVSHAVTWPQIILIMIGMTGWGGILLSVFVPDL